MEKENDNHFATTDLGLATFLQVSGLRLVRLCWENANRASLLFEGRQEGERLRALFFSGEAKVSPLAYKATLDDVKCRLFRERGGRQ